MVQKLYKSGNTFQLGRKLGNDSFGEIFMSLYDDHLGFMFKKWIFNVVEAILAGSFMSV
ncbi:hypothetical protein Hanom_Chr00s001299g01679781 [Helianthus anomalus]